MEQAPSRGNEASPQNGLGVGRKLFSSSKKLRGLSVRAQVRPISTLLFNGQAEGEWGISMLSIWPSTAIITLTNIQGP